MTLPKPTSVRSSEVPDHVRKAREALDRDMGARPLAQGVVARECTLNGRPVIDLAPSRPVNRTILYLHGGGFRMGSARGFTPYCSHLARELSARVVVVDYRLAPENPFPAGLLDALAVYESLRREVPRAGDRELIVAGDSAGGGVAAGLLLEVGKRGDSPDAALLLCPWVDLRVVAQSYDECATTDILYSRAQAEEGVAMYLQGHAPTDPLASPLLADWSGQPPMAIQTSVLEVLRDDARGLAERARRAGVTVSFREFPEQQHVWHYGFPDDPAAKDAFDHLREFLDEKRRA
ncbi:alpha/beta hydrolase [Nocardioides sp. NPDC051685]|uniref:alpha/beta hydrolase n=1 Tax=Nocardioides sp. NPDC051685 TaxID=3364334 RepID=UPI0037A029CA